MTEKESNYRNYYDIIDNPIGFGGFGVVYKAKNKNIGKTRAIKVINKQTIKSTLNSKYIGQSEKIEKDYKKIIEKFKTEVNCMKLCGRNNPNSVKFYRNFETENEFVIVMELCDSNLMNYLQNRREPLNLSEIYDFLIQLNNTFRIMLNNNIVHRDVKLESILIKYKKSKNKKLILKITDYGISKQLKNLSTFLKTNIFSIHYAAPEVLSGEKYSYKCDLWSLGVIIYMLYFKFYPYNAETEFGLLSQIKRLGNKLINKTGNEYFDNLISGLLTENPEKRLTWEQYFEHPFLVNKIFIIIKPKNYILKEKLNKNEEITSIKYNNNNIKIKKYKNSFSDSGFWNTIKNYGLKIGAKSLYAAFSLYYAIPKVSLIDKSLIIGSLGYLISPLDLIPDIIPFFGYMDDAAVLGFAYYKIFKNAQNLKDEVKKDAKCKLKSIFDDLNEDEIEQLL